MTKNTGEKQLKGGQIYFGIQFQKAQSIMVRRAEWNMAVNIKMVRKQRKQQKGDKDKISPRSCP
jgi:hypothetical protein